ncbi:MAG: hypothetical protein K2W96_10645 [Gemmataceae bacterium]|nr:hypothetical protein [Gemmataceae bacterium]
MSQPNSKPTPSSLFRPSLRDWQERFQARRALLNELKGEDEAPAPAVAEEAAPTREKKLLPRKRRVRG